MAAGKAATSFKRFLIFRVIPIVVAVAAFLAGAPWYLALAVLLTAQYWYGPVVIYFRVRMPRISRLEVLASEQELPAEQGAIYTREEPVLTAAGFHLIGRYQTPQRGSSRQRATVALWQNSESSDIVHLMAVTTDTIGKIRIGEVLALSRARADGSRLETMRRSIGSPFPPNPMDNVLMIQGEIATADLLKLHQLRVAADPKAVRNETVTDGLQFQLQEEEQGRNRRVRSGRWQQDTASGNLRPTALGAVLMSLRMLWPWKHLLRNRAQKQVRQLLLQSKK